jgi:hypothetical protein
MRRIEAKKNMVRKAWQRKHRKKILGPFKIASYDSMGR